MTSDQRRLRAHARRIFDAAVAAVRPDVLVDRVWSAGLPDPFDRGALTLVSAGKAAWPMARAAAALGGARIRDALVAGPRVPGDPLPSAWGTVAPAHPLPDAASVLAAEHALSIAGRTAPDHLVVLLSGGASSMLCLPADGITLEDKREASRLLMEQGAAIHELNCVRKHLSSIKGGALAARAGRVLTLAISDVHWPVEDDPSVIGGGPTAADPSTFAEALVIARAVEGMPPAILAHLRRGASGLEPETIKPGDSRIEGSLHRVIGSRRTALDAAAAAAAHLGYAVHVQEPPTHAEARSEAQAFVERAGPLTRERSRPLCVLAAGETTVRVTGSGHGGRNLEFALAAAHALARLDALALVASAGTDGRDGPTDAAGAVADSATLSRAAALGVDPVVGLRNNDTYPFFAALDDLILSGPTGTNVGDLHLLLSAPGDA